MNNIKNVLKIFEEASRDHALATEHGDYKKGNNYYSQILMAADFLRNENAIKLLDRYLSSPYIGTRMWAASYLLNSNEVESIEVLSQIMETKSIHSLTAEITLKEWKMGNLKL